MPDLGWVGFDAANGICTTDAHARVAIGLDYLGAAPVRGTRYGGGTETLTVAVKVEQAGRPGQWQSQSQWYRIVIAGTRRMRKRSVPTQLCIEIVEIWLGHGATRALPTLRMIVIYPATHPRTADCCTGCCRAA